MFKVRWKNEYVVVVVAVVVVVGSIQAGASKHTPGDAKCVTEILGGTKNKEVVLGTNFNFGQLTRGLPPTAITQPPPPFPSHLSSLSLIPLSLPDLPFP